MIGYTRSTQQDHVEMSERVLRKAMMRYTSTVKDEVAYMGYDQLCLLKVLSGLSSVVSCSIGSRLPTKIKLPLCQF